MQFNLFADHQFTPLKNLCDSVFKKLHSKGIEAYLKTTVVLSADDEKKLWDTNVMNLKTPIGLLRVVFFCNGKNFACGVVLSSAILNYHSFREKLLQLMANKLVVIFIRNLDQK